MKRLGCNKSKLDGTEEKFSAPQSLKLPESYSFENNLSPILDQGETSTCVPCSVSSNLNWNINLTKKTPRVDNGVSIKEIYNIRAYKNEDGMSIKEALSYLVKHGVSIKDKTIKKIRRYALVGSLQVLKYAIVMNGPCIGALKVYNDSKTFWKKQTGDFLVGGHAIAIVGFNTKGFIIRNSWGRSWGSNGYTLLPYEDFNCFEELWTIVN
jgi:hypothetical protein